MGGGTVIVADSEKQIKKDYLKKYTRTINKVSHLNYKLMEIDRSLSSVKSQQISDMPRGGQALSLDDLLIRKEETQSRIDAVSTESISIRREIVKKIDELEDYRHIAVLEAFFIDDMTLDEIAEKEGYSLRHTTRLYSEGLKLLKIESESSEREGLS